MNEHLANKDKVKKGGRLEEFMVYQNTLCIYIYIYIYIHLLECMSL